MHKPDKSNLDVDYLRKMGYEHADIDLPVIMKAIVSLFVFIGIMSLMSWGIYILFVPVVMPQQQSPSVIASHVPVGKPVLQANPRIEMRGFKASEQDKITSFGWVDEKAGIAHVPVNETIDKVASSGKLPSAEPGGTPVARAQGEDLKASADPASATTDAPVKESAISVDPGVEKPVK